MNSHIHTGRITTNNTDEFETVARQVAGEIQLTPKYKNKFNASISVCRLHRIGMAILDLSPMRAIIEPQHDFYCLTIPVVNSCHIKDPITSREYTRNTAHLLYPERELDCECRYIGKLLGATFFVSNLDEIAETILGNTNALQPLKGNNISLTTPSGTALTDRLIHIWGK